jgi:MFS transporter, DHA1 family, tetracycline resistance protein
MHILQQLIALLLYIQCMRNKTAALKFIFITILIDVIGFGIIIPVAPKFIQNLQGGTLSEASKIGGYLMFVFAILQFLFAPTLGNLSDKFGRRPVLLFSLFGFGVDYLLTAFAPSITWLFIGRAVAGITGASFTTAAAYIADVSEPEKRAQNFGMIGVAFGIGFIIGPALGGFLGQFDIRLPFFVAAFLAMLNWLYGFVVLPESLSKENRRAFDLKNANPWGAIKILQKYPSIQLMVVGLFLSYIAAQAVQSTWPFYTMEKFNWTEKEVGWSLAFVGLVVAAVQGGLIRFTIPKLGNEKSIYIGLIFYSLGFLLFGLATKGWMMYAFMIIYGLGGIAGPAIQGLISNQIPNNEQGALQGSLTSIMSLSNIIGPLLMTQIFSYFTSSAVSVKIPGAALFVGAFLSFLSLFCAYKSLQKK